MELQYELIFLFIIIIFAVIIARKYFSNDFRIILIIVAMIMSISVFLEILSEYYLVFAILMIGTILFLMINKKV